MSVVADRMMRERNRSRHRERLAILLAALLLAGGVVVDGFTPLGIAAGFPFLLAVLATALGTSPRTTLVTGALALVLCWAGVATSSEGGALVAGLVNRALATVTILGCAAIIVSSQRTERSRLVSIAARLESLSFLATTIAHDFRNLLLVISGLAERGTEEARRDLRTASEQARELVDQLQSYATHFEEDVRTFDLASSVRTCEGLLRLVAAGRTLEVRVETTDAAITGSEAELRQVLVNLVGNARQFTPDASGRVLVRVRALREGELDSLEDVLAGRPDERPYVCLEVEDNGTGVPRALRGRIASPFFSSRPDGKGIGLAAVAGIVEGFGGVLVLDADYAEGARFRLYFPLTRSRTPADTASQPILAGARP